MRLWRRSGRFESLVNTEGFQTDDHRSRVDRKFESLVNTEGFQTHTMPKRSKRWFESLVNTEGFQTARHIYCG